MIVTIHDKREAMQWEGRQVRLGHRAIPNHFIMKADGILLGYDENGICWAPHVGPLKVLDERMEAGKCYRQYTDDVVIEVIEDAEQPSMPALDQAAVDWIVKRHAELHALADELEEREQVDLAATKRARAEGMSVALRKVLGQ